MSVKAIQVSGINKVELTEFPYPEVAEDAIMLKVIYCGICGTDLHGIQGKRDLQFPIIPGHELVAEVAEIGSRALDRIKVFGQSDLQVGDKVTINPRIVCGKCHYCKNVPQRPEMCLGARTYNSSIRSDQPPHLFGGWAQYMYILPDSEIVKLPSDVDLEIASLAEPMACSLSLLDLYSQNRQWGVGDAMRMNKSVVIFGAGAIGLLALACFHLAGATDIVCVDVDEERLKLAEKFGANTLINGADTSSDQRIANVIEICDGIGADIVIEACGVHQTITEAVQMIRRGGVLFEVGHLLKSPPAQIDANYVCRNEISIVGNYAYTSTNYLAMATELLMEAKLPYRDMIRTYPLGDYRQALFEDKDTSAVKRVFKIM